MGGFLYRELIDSPQELAQRIFGLQVDTTFGMKPYAKSFSTVKMPASHVINYCQQGLYSYQKKHLQQALDYFQVALRLDAKNALPYVKKHVPKLLPQIAKILLEHAQQLGDLQQALIFFKIVIALNPKEIRAKKRVKELQNLLKK